MKVVLASGNKNKLREIGEIWGDSVEIISQASLGIGDGPEENGEDFRDNALIKARFVKERTDLPVIADDSGLVIDALGGEPGVHSARFLGEDTPYDVKMKEIISRMSGKTGVYRSARFVCSAVCIMDDGTVLERTGTINGCIGYGMAGSNGFGYDPLFFIDPFDAARAFEISGMSRDEAERLALRLGEENLVTGAVRADLKEYVSTAQLPPDVKDAVSHRGRAFRSLLRDILAAGVRVS